MTCLINDQPCPIAVNPGRIPRKQEPIMIRSLLLLLLLAGCAMDLSGSEFHKPGVTSAQRMSDIQSCSAYADRNRGPMTAGGPQGAAEVKERRDELFGNCMMDRGYRSI
jgi:hypothetical protein